MGAWNGGPTGWQGCFLRPFMQKNKRSGPPGSEQGLSMTHPRLHYANHKWQQQGHIAITLLFIVAMHNVPIILYLASCYCMIRETSHLCNHFSQGLSQFLCNHGNPLSYLYLWVYPDQINWVASCWISVTTSAKGSSIQPWQPTKAVISRTLVLVSTLVAE